MFVFDFRLTPKNQDHDQWDEGKIKKLFRNWCKKWAFQIELGKQTSKYHIQARLSSKTNTTKAAMMDRIVNKLREEGDSYFFEPTAKVNQGNAFYVIKVGTRVRGPWTDKDNNRYIQHRFRDPSPRVWQQRLCAVLDKWVVERNDRNIIYICDEGNTGKSWFRGWLKATHENVVNIPATLNDGNDMMRYLCGMVDDGWRGIITIDIPRATSAKHWWGLARGLESIKQGDLHDERYTATEKVIEPPQMVCFMNKRPPDGCMSPDVFYEWSIEHNSFVGKESKNSFLFKKRKLSHESSPGPPPPIMACALRLTDENVKPSDSPPMTAVLGSDKLTMESTLI